MRGSCLVVARCLVLPSFISFTTHNFYGRFNHFFVGEKMGGTPLLRACESGDRDTVAILLAQGANMYISDKVYRTWNSLLRID